MILSSLFFRGCDAGSLPPFFDSRPYGMIYLEENNGVRVLVRDSAPIFKWDEAGSESDKWLYVDPEYPEVYSSLAWHTRLNVL